MAPTLEPKMRSGPRKRARYFREDIPEGNPDYLTFCEHTKCFGKYYVFSMGSISRTYEKEHDVIHKDGADDFDGSRMLPSDTIKENIVDIDEVDDLDDAYMLFLSKMEEHESSYAVCCENNGVPVRIIYGIENSLEDCVPECWGKTSSCFAGDGECSSQEPGPINDHEPTKRDDFEQNPRKLLNRLNKRGRKGKGNDVPNQSAKLQTDVRNQDIKEMEAPSPKKRGLDISRTVGEKHGENFIQICDGVSYHKQDERFNWVVSQKHHDNPVALVKERKIKSWNNSRIFQWADIVDTENYEACRPISVQIRNGLGYPRYSLRDRLDRFDQVQALENQKVQRQSKEADMVTGTKRKAVVKIEDAYEHKNLDQIETSGTKYLQEHMAPARPVKRNSMQRQRKLVKGFRGKNVVKGDGEVGRIDPKGKMLAGSVSYKKRNLIVFMSKTSYYLKPGHPSSHSKYRAQLLDALKKPYDRDESRRHREELQRGSYVKFYPDLGRKLTRCRYNQAKCLTILRGFFFWLQNMTQDGSFKPWKDRECLAVDPSSQ